jgi:putative aminopeptidase FrvX
MKGMDYISVLTRLTGLPGVSGHEKSVAGAVEEYFRQQTDDVWRDAVGNVFARIGSDKAGSGKPVIMIAAHMDEIGMVVTDILDRGFLRIASVAGVDPRVLPGSEVIVDGRTPLKGIVGAVPPHLVTDNSKTYKMDELSVDVGLPEEKVKELVSVGDMVRFDALPPLKLKNDFVASKTMDDRAHVAVMLRAMELLSKIKLECTVVFCATVQEERGGIGALTGSYSVEPDIAIAIDVCHGKIPGATVYDSFDMEKVVLTRGSNVHPKVLDMLKDAAQDLGIPIDIEANIGPSGTDAWEMQIAGNGAATAVVSTPLKYMHTSVELLSTKTLDNCARMIAQFAANIGADWEEKLCLDD